MPLPLPNASQGLRHRRDRAQVSELFRIIQEKARLDQDDCRVGVSVTEIYNEELRDLLQTDPRSGGDGRPKEGKPLNVSQGASLLVPGHPFYLGDQDLPGAPWCAYLRWSGHRLCFPGTIR